MNLPTNIAFENGNNIRYTYDASGVKLKKEVVCCDSHALVRRHLFAEIG